MHRISEKLANKFTISLEFFPPKTEKGENNLIKAIDEIISYKDGFTPDFASITFGAGGSSKSKTMHVASLIKEKFNISILEHFTCYGLSKEETSNIIKQIKEQGIINILALRGDKPKNNPNFIPADDSLKYASELVEFILKHDNFDVGVAGYPEGHPDAPSLDYDIEKLKLKIDNGAKFVITQLFLDNNDYYEYVNKARKIGIKVPIIPGMLPFISYNNITTFTELSKAKLPKEIKNVIEKHKDDDEYITKFGIENTLKQIEGLKKFGIPGIHFFTLNKSYSIIEILKEIL